MIRGCSRFALLRSVIDLENRHHFINQSDAKTETNHDLTARAFPRFGQFGCFEFEFSLVLMVISFLLIGRWDYLSFGFTALSRKAFC